MLVIKTISLKFKKIVKSNIVLILKILMRITEYLIN